MSKATTYAEKVQTIEAALDACVPQTGAPYEDNAIPARMAEAIRYSLLAGGKRLRPVLLLTVVEMLDGDQAEAMPLACALEMIHTYSLIHDDLPGMDDDDLRRGVPTNHRVFGVGMAILAGDGLLNLAHEHMLQNALRYPARLSAHVRAMAEISRRAGVTGMIAGQCMDILSEGQAGDAGLLRYIHTHKTADLITAAVLAGAQLCQASPMQCDALKQFGRSVGLAFQIADDLLDLHGDVALLGKHIGMDAQLGKLTWPSLLGESDARAEADRLLDDAKAALLPFGQRAEPLSQLAEQLVHRMS